MSDMRVRDLLAALDAMDPAAEVGFVLHLPLACCSDEHGERHSHDGNPDLDGEVTAVDVWPASLLQITLRVRDDPDAS